MSDSRVTLSIRIRPSSVQWADELAAEHGIPRAEVLRYALGIAKTHEKELIEVLKRAS